ncbi:MAG: signal recognition particle-docking protein FtsY [Bacillota bacterium]|nr:signal recognition particle-docking protein FtsY [Bacillota bacterium]MDD3297488.1 signal recognition particle-docking protein FtsY [Bacillota bacterium]MDD3850161.1 signal recognition particle-docking protein FtsY [Bacillota bacterium]MDD4706884.1 signal recognition particle-docking protein FtsY [Bacillota bacterium]
MQEERHSGLIPRFMEGLRKSREDIKKKVDLLLSLGNKPEPEMLEELEEVLITADVGVGTSLEIIGVLNERIKQDKGIVGERVREELKSIIREMLDGEGVKNILEGRPSVILVVGVNGVGKTTSIGKLAALYKRKGKRVLIAAADTFRAAAIEQLEVWGQRAGVELIKHSEGSDPAAVVFDALSAARARNADIVICDTAGRLHNKKNLMEELKKIQRIINREAEGRIRETYLVLDATTGQNALAQAKMFKEITDITGIILTKLDGTAKGGIVLAIKNELDIPVKYIGLGEGMEDLQPFDGKAFADAFLG